MGTLKIIYTHTKVRNMMARITIILILLAMTGNNLFVFETQSYDKHYALPAIPSYKGECKLVMAVGNATAGNYNLLLKVRDPARPGLQVLCFIPRGYEYEYHHPWLPHKIHFRVEHTFVGTTTLNDIPPSIIKPGMLMNDAGIAIGDADTISYLRNPSIYAWDDFDWMRYAIQSAGTLEEAIELLTKDAVSKMHASSVAENFFVVSGEKGAIVEADAFNYRIKEIQNGLEIQSNYPEMLWNVHLLYPLFIASSFNTTFTGWVKQGDVVRIGGLMGVTISDISSNHITARLFPAGLKKRINVGNGKQIGNFWVEVEDIEKDRARIFMCFNYYEWEAKIRNFVSDRVGNISLRDMMMLSRIHSEEIENLRGMCQGGYEAATIYKIPHNHPEIFSSLWFAPDQCASIFVPVHICDEDIYDAYENGEAHSIAMKLLERYGHGNLTSIFEEVEKDFINETENAESVAWQILMEGGREDAIRLLTLTDMGMQMKAMAIEKMWLNASYLSNKLFSRVYPLLKEICRNLDRPSEITRFLEILSSMMKAAGNEDRDHLRNIQILAHDLLMQKCGRRDFRANLHSLPQVAVRTRALSLEGSYPNQLDHARTEGIKGG